MQSFSFTGGAEDQGFNHFLYISSTRIKFQINKMKAELNRLILKLDVFLQATLIKAVLADTETGVFLVRWIKSHSSDSESGIFVLSHSGGLEFSSSYRAIYG